LEAKRTSLHPDLAGLLVHLLEGAGVRSGDTVALGASGSFPGLLLAGLAAVKALEARPVSILSLGASSFGATRPELHLLRIYRIFQDGGIVDVPPAAVSLGGEGDVGGGLSQVLREELRRAVSDAGVPLLEFPDLAENVAHRMEIYGRPAAFVNAGGAEANLGTSPAVLGLPPGLLLPAGIRWDGEIPGRARRGVLFEMLARDVPVLHLLHIRGLALRHGLPWDPVPLPEPGTAPLLSGSSGTGVGLWTITAGYLLGLGLVLLWPRRRTCDSEPRRIPRPPGAAEAPIP
jgi:poly-gamma-glutamate system protein